MCLCVYVYRMGGAQGIFLNKGRPFIWTSFDKGFPPYKRLPRRTTRYLPFDC